MLFRSFPSHDSGDRVYSYEQVIAMLRNELKDVHKRFKDETVEYWIQEKLSFVEVLILLLVAVQVVSWSM